MQTQSIYERVTDKIIAKLKEGVVPWRVSWKQTPIPVSGVSKRPYRGINSLILALEGYRSPYWMTFKQIAAQGGRVRKGEKATTVVFSRWIEIEEEGSDKKSHRAVLKHYNVFNQFQCEGLPDSEPTSEDSRD